ncbi:MAG: hypothetical protein Pg6A_13240 [Termitinemataceae bacterium]|nr:MAG: hypothetical protein Pg6A_13240 [Termitinemataceae bacterium]
MTKMTEEEADALDELLTRTTPELTDIPGMFERNDNLLNALDKVSANYILTKAHATGETPAQVIGSMVRRELRASS